VDGVRWLSGGALYTWTGRVLCSRPENNQHSGPTAAASLLCAAGTRRRRMDGWVWAYAARRATGNHSRGPASRSAPAGEQYLRGRTSAGWLSRTKPAVRMLFARRYIPVAIPIPMPIPIIATDSCRQLLLSRVQLFRSGWGWSTLSTVLHAHASTQRCPSGRAAGSAGCGSWRSQIRQSRTDR
jgi:hypothetical protein